MYFSRYEDHKVIVNEFIKECSQKLGIDFNDVKTVRDRMEEIGKFLIEFLKSKDLKIDGFEIIENYEPRFVFLDKVRKIKKAIVVYGLRKIGNKMVKVIYGYIPARRFKHFLYETIKSIAFDKDLDRYYIPDFYSPLKNDERVRDVKELIVNKLKNLGYTRFEIYIHDEGAIDISKPENLPDDVKALVKALYLLKSIDDIVEINHVENIVKYNISGIELTVLVP